MNAVCQRHGCTNEFAVTSSTHKFCSDRCRGADAERRRERMPLALVRTLSLYRVRMSLADAVFLCHAIGMTRVSWWLMERGVSWKRGYWIARIADGVGV